MCSNPKAQTTSSEQRGKSDSSIAGGVLCSLSSQVRTLGAQLAPEESDRGGVAQARPPGGAVRSANINRPREGGRCGACEAPSRARDMGSTTSGMRPATRLSRALPGWRRCGMRPWWRPRAACRPAHQVLARPEANLQVPLATERLLPRLRLGTAALCGRGNDLLRPGRLPSAVGQPSHQR